MKRIIPLILIIICVFYAFGCTSNNTKSSKDLDSDKSSSTLVTKLNADISYKILEKAKEKEEEASKEKEEEIIAEEELAQTEVPVEEYYYNDNQYNYDYTYTDNSNYNDYSIPSSGLTPQSGVNYYDGRTETYYSSNVLYHYRTNEWTVDNEGFYRTDEGYYVVAASDMPQGTTFEGSKGTCIVLDSGCAEGVTDYYVSWN